MKQFSLILIFFLPLLAFAQSTNQDYPSPVLQNEISGEIAARDIGDARLTRHFYTFYANVGDLVLNVETQNFNGDVDFFESVTLRPLAKVTIYDTGSAAATNRTIYFRQRRQIVMRVEGRTTNDEPARYRINFSGTFAAATDLPPPPEDLEPKVKNAATSGDAIARVNSAGAIVEVSPPKNQPGIATATESKSEPGKEKPTEEIAAKPTPRRTNPRTSRSRAARRSAPPAKIETPSETAETKPDSAAAAAPTPPRPPRAPRRNDSAARRGAGKQPAKSATNVEPKADPLANLRLVVLLKDGEKIERSMADVFRAAVDQGTLVVITKDGKIQRFALLDVLKFSIEQ